MDADMKGWRTLFLNPGATGNRSLIPVVALNALLSCAGGKTL